MVRKGQRIEVLSAPAAPSLQNKHQGPYVYGALTVEGWLPLQNLELCVDGAHGSA